MIDLVTAKERLAAFSIDDNFYYCDKCEETICHNEESFDISYGYICQKCDGH